MILCNFCTIYPHRQKKNTILEIKKKTSLKNLPKVSVSFIMDDHIFLKAFPCPFSFDICIH